MLRKNNLSVKSVKNANSKKKNSRHKQQQQAQNESAPVKSVVTGHSVDKNATPVVQSNQNNDVKIDPESQWDAYMENSITCYHAKIPIEDMEDLLKMNGDFLLRRAENNGKTEFVFTVYKDKQLHDIVLNRSSEGCYIIKGTAFSRPEELIDHYIISHIPVDGKSLFFVKGIERRSYYLNPENIEIKQKIGEGAFGEVNEGVMKRFDTTAIKVAVKNLKGFSSKQDRDDFMEEFRFMNRFEHENIVKIYGITTQGTVMMMVLEMCYGGSLNSYLKKNPLPYKHLIKYCIDAARGMCYLSTRNVIHRDIAARNCLLGGNDEVKISDFGLSVISKNPVKAGKNQKIAIRWCAPETISTGFFEMKTDVWSFGILIWEIFNHCKADPYSGKTNAEVKRDLLNNTQSLLLPRDAPSNVLKCYTYCLFKEAAFRPNFIEILKFLSPRERPPVPSDMKKCIPSKPSNVDSKTQNIVSKGKQPGC